MGANAHLIDSHLTLVRTVARRYVGRGEELDDLVQVGAMGLVKASDRFDPNRGVAFAAFVTPAIEGEIRRHLRDRARSVKIPRDLQQTSRNVRRQQAEMAAALGRFPTSGEVAAALEIDQAEVERAVAADRAVDPVAIDAGDDALELSRAFDPADVSDDRMLLAASMRVLGERERRIVFLRFHADMTEREISKAVGVSQAHVSRLLDGALVKLRADMAAGASAQTRDTTPNPVISNVPGAKIGQMSAPRGANSAQQAKQKQKSSYSGKFLVRMPSELHEQLAHAAQQEDVSLNRFVTDVLDASVSARSASPPEPGSADSGSQLGGHDRVPPTGARLSPSTVRVALATNLVVVVAAGVIAVVLLVLALQRGI